MTCNSVHTLLHAYRVKKVYWEKLNQVYLNVEVLAEGRVVDSGVVDNAQPISLAALASPYLASPSLHMSIASRLRLRLRLGLELSLCLRL